MLEPSFDTTEVNDWLVLRVRGELDMATAPRLRQQMVAAANLGVTQFVLDLDDVDFLDSTALGVIVGGVKRFRTNGGEFRVVCTRKNLVELFEITRLTNVFALFSTVEAATAPPDPDESVL